MAKLLEQFEASFSEQDWKAMSEAEKLSLIFRWFELKIFETKSNKSATQIMNDEQEQKKQEYITHLQTLGYICDNGIGDYKKLYGRPEIFGAEWEAKAELAHAESTSLDDFLNLTIKYL